MNPPLPKKERARQLAAVARLPNEAIARSNLPAADLARWKDAVPGHLYRPVKQATTIRIDADVLAWLKAQGKGYQTRINAILRREMLAALKESAGHE